ncbi:3'(2'),5'-bisphosphate nucleotidase [Winogradskyella epiphytica]|uniref:3'(2'),5'-bisphosphate nucleotidase CysQ n=1 Tax=Winogradskyella epiphytica TaxID=262005 RepID=A0A2V4YFM7_9FLAO|nr:3'(2'),5'-bisphosphate nucleotidase CysQ [Winogradskyella epiphytica]PYE82713.1 3'(2'),5'-bisphosphate nucleotidase [Winogradskyella epiphytica]GGW53151.1 3'(2'),5'-bisphosphate nucleotidase CysQ [Winogradskyella epiphytica]
MKKKNNQPSHRSTDSPNHRFPDSPNHSLTNSPTHRSTDSPPHSLTASRSPRLTDSPPPRLTDSPPHLKTAITAALEAGKAILDIYYSNEFDVELKGDNSPLTKADIAAHHVIISYLSETNIPILSEEGKHLPYEIRSTWNTLWIVDPIDGTKEFIKKNGEFTVNIALVENQIPILGVIYVPVLKELYFASKDLGSYKVKDINEFTCIKKLTENAEKLPLNESTDLQKNEFTVVASKSHLSKETEDYIGELEKQHGAVTTISKGSSLKLCMVAEGQADCYPRFAPTMEWDTAAGQAICEQAGFQVMDWVTKKPMLYNREQLLNNWFVVR